MKNSFELEESIPWTNTQLDYDHLFMNFAVNISRFSKCVSHHVGAVLTKDNRVISHGVNGTRPGEINCCERFPAYDKETMREAHREWSELHEWHAEANAISYALKQKQDLEGTTLYVTVAPCFNCCKNWIGLFGVKRVIYLEEYDACGVERVRELLRTHGCRLEKYSELFSGVEQ